MLVIGLTGASPAIPVFYGHRRAAPLNSAFGTSFVRKIRSADRVINNKIAVRNYYYRPHHPSFLFIKADCYFILYDVIHKNNYELTTSILVQLVSELLGHPPPLNNNSRIQPLYKYFVSDSSEIAMGLFGSSDPVKETEKALARGKYT